MSKDDFFIALLLGVLHVKGILSEVEMLKMKYHLEKFKGTEINEKSLTSMLAEILADLD